MPRVVRAERPAPAPKAAPVIKHQSNGASGLSGPQQKIVDALAFWMGLGHDAPSRVQVAFVAGYKPNTGSFNTYLGSLSTGGYIEYPNKGLVSLTAAGDACAALQECPTGEAFRERVLSILTGPQKKLTAALIEAYPQAIGRDELAIRTDYKPGTGSFNTYLGSLSTLTIAEYPQRGQVRAADWLFP